MLTPEQQEARKGKLGSSQAAAVALGKNAFGTTAYDVWAVLTGRASEFEGNEATESGNLLEEPLLQFAEKRLGKPIVRAQTFIHPSQLLVANLDGVILNAEGVPAELTEAKSSGMYERWGLDESDVVPDEVLIQVHHQVVCCPTIERVHVPLVVPAYRRFDWRLLQIPIDPELLTVVEESGLRFMIEFVAKDTPPPNSFASLDVIKRIRREPAKLVPFTDEDAQLVEEWDTVRRDRLELEKRETTALEKALTHLGDAEAAMLPDGRMFTYTSQRGAPLFDRDGLRAEYPEIADRFTTETTHRVARLKKSKGRNRE